jgi:hypothetical protein
MKRRQRPLRLRQISGTSVLPIEKMLIVVLANRAEVALGSRIKPRREPRPSDLKGRGLAKPTGDIGPGRRAPACILRTLTYIDINGHEKPRAEQMRTQGGVRAGAALVRDLARWSYAKQ